MAQPTKTNPLTEAVPPAGADLVDEWQADDAQPYRVIFGADRTIADTEIRVYAAAVQLADGSIDRGRVEKPSVNISDNGCDGPRVDVAQARELAAALLEAVRQIEGWQ